MVRNTVGPIRGYRNIGIIKQKDYFSVFTAIKFRCSAKAAKSRYFSFGSRPFASVIGSKRLLSHLDRVHDTVFPVNP